MRIDNGQFVRRFGLIPVYLTSLLYYFNRPLFLVWWFIWQWARVGFCSCIHTLRCALINVSCIFSMYWKVERWILKPNVKGVAYWWGWRNAHLPNESWLITDNFLVVFVLIPVYLTSLLYYFNRPLSLVWWFCWHCGGQESPYVLAFIHWDAHWLKCLAS